ncbi:hypothetical protein QBC47DRAFT_25246 [Echria macrotheca]|uniref:F-box domain-containing protein n=1 Tax=Echria macrotheca TaxID=438768 RepID=A0AAJ0FBN8_9PEZI|nr:hypothetical protein QBC47DRAFT_25246 [Echria macrotheca]
MESTASQDPSSNPFLQRQEHLNQIISTLSRHEIRKILKDLGKVDFRMDILPSLPVELQMLVVGSIADLADVLGYLRVSKAWRELWLRPDVVRTLCQRFVPGLIPFANARAKLAGVEPREADLTPMFLAALRDRCFRRAGRFRSQFGIGTADRYPGPFPLDPVYHREPGFELMRFLDDRSRYEEHSSIERMGILYSNSRVTWNPPRDQPWVIVDNLRTKLRTVYAVPGLAMAGLSATVVALGDQLLVVAAGRTLHAWDLETHQYDTVTLPYYAALVRTAGKRICISWGPVSIFPHEWIFGRGIKSLEGPREFPILPGLPISNLLNIRIHEHTSAHEHPHYDALLHPLDDSVLWLFFLSPRDQCLVAHEFKDRVYRRSIVLACPSIRSADRPLLSISRANRYGEYLVLMPKTFFGQPGQHRRVEPELIDQMICFDIFRGEFITYDYRLGNSLEDRLANPLWDGQLFVCKSSSLPKAVPPHSIIWDRLYLVVATDPTGHPDPDRRVPPIHRGIDRGIPNSLNAIRSGSGFLHPDSIRCYLASETRYCLELQAGRDVDNLSRERLPGQLWVDEGFVVLALEDRWMAWSFDTDLSFPGPN